MTVKTEFPTIEAVKKSIAEAIRIIDRHGGSIDQIPKIINDKHNNCNTFIYIDETGKAVIDVYYTPNKPMKYITLKLEIKNNEAIFNDCET